MRTFRNNLITAVLLATRLAVSAETAATGITATRASKLASDYMECYIGGCGGLEEPIARGDHWEVPVRFGFVGAREGAIQVDRRTGVLSYSWKGHSKPTVSPEQLERAVKRLHQSRRKA